MAPLSSIDFYDNTTFGTPLKGYSAAEIDIFKFEDY
jgi:hypothetical protein